MMRGYWPKVTRREERDEWSSEPRRGLVKQDLKVVVDDVAAKQTDCTEEAECKQEEVGEPRRGV